MLVRKLLTYIKTNSTIFKLIPVTVFCATASAACCCRRLTMRWKWRFGRNRSGPGFTVLMKDSLGTDPRQARLTNGFWIEKNKTSIFMRDNSLSATKLGVWHATIHNYGSQKWSIQYPNNERSLASPDIDSHREYSTTSNFKVVKLLAWKYAIPLCCHHNIKAKWRYQLTISTFSTVACFNSSDWVRQQQRRQFFKPGINPVCQQ